MVGSDNNEWAYYGWGWLLVLELATVVFRLVLVLLALGLMKRIYVSIRFEHVRAPLVLELGQIITSAVGYVHWMICAGDSTY